MSGDACLGNDTLVAYVDGASSVEIKARVEGHAASCASCREMLTLLARGTAPATQPGGAPGVATMPARLGRYIVERELGAGGMGVVYAARDPELDRTVAIKLLHGDGGPEMQQRLRREAQTMAQLAHPHVVRVYDVGIDPASQHVFVAMELIEGETLSRWERGDRTVREILATYAAAGRGLAAAHAAGIVHRDFKPDNVLIGRDGEPRVADFGLARSGGGLAPAVTVLGDLGATPVSPDAPTEAVQPSHTVIAGTPFYMAPELYTGGEADARSDQFSFAVALYVALYRQRPFDGDDLATLSANVRAGRLREEPSRGVPRRVRAAVRRALSVRPDDRFAQMADLLVVLAPPGRRRIAIPAGLVVAGGLIAAGLVARGRHVDPCGGADPALARVWSPVQRAAVATALHATGVPFAATAELEVDRGLDRYAADWRQMRIGACEATRVHAEQTEEVLELRMSCLDQRLASFAELVATLSHRDPVTATRAATAVAALPSIDECADVAALTSVIKPPNPAIKGEVETVRRSLAAIRARMDAGQVTGPLAEVRGLEPRVQALGYRPLEAELAFVRGDLETDREQFAAARASFEQAALAADAGRADRLATRALVSLSVVLGQDLGLPTDAAQVAARITAQLERLDHPAELEAVALVARGRNAMQSATLDAAEHDLRAALALDEKHYGDSALQVIEPLQLLGSLEQQREHPAPAHAYLERALAIQRRLLGEQHPEVAVTLDALAGADYIAGNYDVALAGYRRVLAIYEANDGPTSLAVANTLSNMARVQEWQGDPAAAIAGYRRAIAIAEPRLGPTHRYVLSYRASLASALEDNEQHAEALALLTDVLAQQRKALGAHQDTASTLQQLAFVELAMGSAAAARDHAAEAYAMAKQTLGASYGGADELTVLGSAELELGHAAAAVTALADAEAHVDATTDAAPRAWLDAQYGRALIDAGGDRAKGLALVRSARRALAADDRAADRVQQIDAWLARRRITLR